MPCPKSGLNLVTASIVRMLALGRAYAPLEPASPRRSVACLSSGVYQHDECSRGVWDPNVPQLLEVRALEPYIFLLNVACLWKNSKLGVHSGGPWFELQ